MVNQTMVKAVHAIENKRDGVFNGVGKLKDYVMFKKRIAAEWF